MTPEEQAAQSAELYRRMEEGILDGAIESAVKFNQEKEKSSGTDKQEQPTIESNNKNG